MYNEIANERKEVRQDGRQSASIRIQRWTLAKKPKEMAPKKYGNRASRGLQGRRKRGSLSWHQSKLCQQLNYVICLTLSPHTHTHGMGGQGRGLQGVNSGTCMAWKIGKTEPNRTEPNWTKRGQVPKKKIKLRKPNWNEDDENASSSNQAQCTGKTKIFIGNKIDTLYLLRNGNNDEKQ